MEKTLTKTNFQAEVASNELTVVDFWATWCGPCKMLAPVLQQVVEETGLNVGKVNVDEEQELAMQYGIQVIPTLVFFKGGAELGRVSGYMDKSALLSQIAKYN